MTEKEANVYLVLLKDGRFALGQDTRIHPFDKGWYLLEGNKRARLLSKEEVDTLVEDIDKVKLEVNDEETRFL